MNDLEIGWVAGIIDGEGSVCLFSKEREQTAFRVHMLEVSSTDREIIDRLHALMGGIIATIGMRPRMTKPAWLWSLRGEERVCGVLRIIEPAMTCPKKKARARWLLSHYPQLRRRNGRYTEEEKAIKRAFEAGFRAIE